MTVKELSEIFYNYALGASAIVAVLGGIFAFVPGLRCWIKFRYYRHKYSPKHFVSRYELIQIPETAPVYIHDKDSGVIRHVANPDTMTDLGFDWNKVRFVTVEEYRTFKLGYPVNTTR